MGVFLSRPFRCAACGDLAVHVGTYWARSEGEPWHPVTLVSCHGCGAQVIANATDLACEQPAYARPVT